jgi:putative ribosome biogenesis GTPase RsgA
LVIAVQANLRARLSMLAVSDKVNTALTLQATQTILYSNELSTAGLVVETHISRNLLLTRTYVANRQTRVFVCATIHSSFPEFNFI